MKQKAMAIFSIMLFLAFATVYCRALSTGGKSPTQDRQKSYNVTMIASDLSFTIC
ncbi:MAG: hypothetical protein GTO29_14750 [Candidatus Latescibacteria bacterium]|nr:hypothetical protein [Candidatus Latescibacterota bacterium]NIO57409.1 hypothetical protein [Candidatus Latescibacterota bacterium]